MRSANPAQAPAQPVPAGAVQAVRWRPPPAGDGAGSHAPGDGAGPAVLLLDQTALPATERDLACTDVDQLVDAVQRLVVRGAPLLGLAGAYGVALAAAVEPTPDRVRAAAQRLAAARPTAVNLSRGVAASLAAFEAALAAERTVDWAAERAGEVVGDGAGRGGRTATSSRGRALDAGAAAALAAARALDLAGRAESAAMAAYGLALVPPSARILTHCNTGSLAAPGDGTAFAVVVAAALAGRLAQLWVDETRPLRQGARLTAWEASRRGLPYAVLADAAAGSLLASGLVDLVLVGADRVAADGSVANKVGTYPLAVLARRHGVPFVVVAPTSTVDLSTHSGTSIPVEQRDPAEVSEWRPVSGTSALTWSPAFDVTPPDLVTALVTERGVVRQLSRGRLRCVVTGTDPATAAARTGGPDDGPVGPPTCGTG